MTTQRFLLVFLLGMIIALGTGIAPGSIASAMEAGPGDGLVIFSRKKSPKGKAIRFNIDQDGRPIGQLLSGTTLKIPLAPGSYNFTVRAPSLDGQDFLTVNDVTGRYIFYLSDGTGGTTATGIPRSSVRVEVRSLDFDTWVAETYSSVDGQSVRVQSYRFTSR